MPEGAVYVGRPTIWGNPWVPNEDWGRMPEPGRRDEALRKCVETFRAWLSGAKGTGGGGLRRIALLSRISELRGKDLACWCPLDQPCHADVLLEIANATVQAQTQKGEGK